MFLNFDEFLSLKIVFIVANIADSRIGLQARLSVYHLQHYLQYVCNIHEY